MYKSFCFDLIVLILLYHVQDLVSSSLTVNVIEQVSKPLLEKIHQGLSNLFINHFTYYKIGSGNTGETASSTDSVASSN